MAMRSILNLDINLGLFGFPVAVYKATNEPTEGIAFRQLHRVCSTPINQVKRCATCNADVPTSDLVKGYPEGTAFITITDDELKALKPEAAGIISIAGYLSHDEIDESFHVGSVYYLKPGGKDPTTFATWREGLEGRFAIGTVVMYGREHVVAIRAFDRLLALHMLRSKAEVRLAADVPGYDKVPTTARPEHVELMRQLIERESITFDDVVIEKDKYVTAVQELIESKRTGVPLAGRPAPPAPHQSADIMAALKASLAAPRKTRAA